MAIPVVRFNEDRWLSLRFVAIEKVNTVHIAVVVVVGLRTL